MSMEDLGEALQRLLPHSLGGLRHRVDMYGCWIIPTFVLDVKLPLLPEASEGGNASAWANQDAGDLGISGQVEAGGTGQGRERSLAELSSDQELWRLR
jgi:hypothetical protein